MRFNFFPHNLPKTAEHIIVSLDVDCIHLGNPASDVLFKHFRQIRERTNGNTYIIHANGQLVDNLLDNTRACRIVFINDKQVHVGKQGFLISCKAPAHTETISTLCPLRPPASFYVCRPEQRVSHNRPSSHCNDMNKVLICR